MVLSYQFQVSCVYEKKYNDTNSFSFRFDFIQSLADQLLKLLAKKGTERKRERNESTSLHS